MPKFTVVRAQRMRMWDITTTTVDAPSASIAIALAMNYEEDYVFKPVKNHGKETEYSSAGFSACSPSNMDDAIDTACENAE